MRSRRSLSWLLEKEGRELLTSRAWWVLLVAMGPLVGVSFTSAVRTYAEVSGLGGTAAGVGEALSPLVGIWAPTFSACELAAAFLLPFVAIRLVGGDRQSGAATLELQHPMSPFVRVTAKGVVLFAAWLCALVPAFVTIALWKIYGGVIYSPEVLSVVLGHVLNAALTIAIAAAAASLTEHPSTAAIVTLAVTVGTWMLNFVADVQGGIWERAAAYTPTAMVAQFQHGLINIDVVLIAVAMVLCGFTLAAIWIRRGVGVRRRVYESVGVAVAAALVVMLSTLMTASVDASENRMNSLPERDEAVLRHIRGPLRIEAHLAPEDPRRTDLERQTLAKLRRVMRVDVTYISSTHIGLFEQTAAHYGEIWYQLGDHRVMARATTTEAVLETIYGLAGVPPPADDGEVVFRGHPLAQPARGAPLLFYVMWPMLIISLGVVVRRRMA